VPICLIGMVVVPWLAVMLANDRPPKRRPRPAERIPEPTGPERAALPPATPIRVIDPD
jgi:hypothetical protein